MHDVHEVNLSDGIVALSPPGPDDVDAHLAGEDELQIRWLSEKPATRADIEAYFRRCAEQWSVRGPLRAFGIRSADRSTLMGYIDLRFDVAGLAPGQANISYTLYPDWRGRGLATRAVRLICRYAASEGVARAVIRVDPENPASAAVARRSGFVHDRRIVEEDGHLIDWYLFDLSGGADLSGVAEPPDDVDLPTAR
ncbi:MULTISPECIES: GNAT family N-acetyltransferase [unclassified Streptomyces]|uniref:GNAT family N-acetyltransferase n=1 Tax=unclassified Streptomyces TaxID=2593676 RepID=UPI0011E652E9|nr:GNAT family N-acetyltransferase [Streptomyces sp. sk2.1]TXS68811.1 N-acetyltransferase [Streptomyces sp. sk2.1]